MKILSVSFDVSNLLSHHTDTKKASSFFSCSWGELVGSDCQVAKKWYCCLHNQTSNMEQTNIDSLKRNGLKTPNMFIVVVSCCFIQPSDFLNGTYLLSCNQIRIHPRMISGPIWSFTSRWRRAEFSGESVTTVRRVVATDTKDSFEYICRSIYKHWLIHKRDVDGRKVSGVYSYRSMLYFIFFLTREGKIRHNSLIMLILIIIHPIIEKWHFESKLRSYFEGYFPVEFMLTACLSESAASDDTCLHPVHIFISWKVNQLLLPTKEVKLKY